MDECRAYPLLQEIICFAEKLFCLPRKSDNHIYAEKHFRAIVFVSVVYFYACYFALDYDKNFAFKVNASRAIEQQRVSTVQEAMEDDRAFPLRR